MDINKWSPLTDLPLRPGAEKPAGQPAVKLQAIRLNEVQLANVMDRQFRPHLDFLYHDKQVSFTLYSNPPFVHVPNYQGASHPMHEGLVQMMISGITLTKNLMIGVPITSRGC